MTATQLLAELDRRGITLTPTASGLRYHPRSAMPPDLLAALTRHRAAVYDVLLQTQARALLARSDGSPAWAAQWAALHDLWGLPCCGFPTWAAWAEDVARHPTGANPPSQQSLRPDRFRQRSATTAVPNIWKVNTQ